MTALAWLWRRGTPRTSLSWATRVVFKAGHVEPGSHAELIARPRAMVAPKPAAIGHVEAAAGIHAGTCAWIALVREARLEAGMKVLIQGGAGAIGGLAIQLAKHLGAAPIAATCRRANCDYVRILGADIAIAYDEEDFRDRVDGCDVVLDLVGGEVHNRSYEVIRPGGVLTWLIAQPFAARAGGTEVVERQAVIDDDPAALEAVGRADRRRRPEAAGVRGDAAGGGGPRPPPDRGRRRQPRAHRPPGAVRGGHRPWRVSGSIAAGQRRERTCRGASSSG